PDEALAYIKFTQTRRCASAMRHASLIFPGRGMKQRARCPPSLPEPVVSEPLCTISSDRPAIEVISLSTDQPILARVTGCERLFEPSIFAIQRNKVTLVSIDYELICLRAMG